MYQEFYEGSTLLSLPIITLILFVAVFAIVVIREWRNGANNSEHAHLGSLPLEDDHCQVNRPEPSGSAPKGGTDRG